jgi:hypothetical protein
LDSTEEHGEALKRDEEEHREAWNRSPEDSGRAWRSLEGLGGALISPENL